MTSQLDGLKRHSVIVADTGDIESIARFRPQDATTNPSLIFKAATTPFAKYCTRMERNIASAAPYTMPEASDDRHGYRVNLKAGIRDLKRVFQDFVSGMRAAGPSLAVNHSYF